MFTLKDATGNEIKITTQVFVPHLKRSGIVTGTTMDGSVNVRLSASKLPTGNDIEDGVRDIICEPSDLMVRTSTFLLAIDEAQRLALMSLINNHGAAFVQPDGPLEFWHDMLLDLPKNEMESPGIINGFCF